MSAEATLLAALTAWPALTALVGDEIHRSAQPEGGAWPCVVFARADTEPIDTIHGTRLGAFVPFDLYCSAENDTDAQDTAVEVENALLAIGESPRARRGGYDPDAGLYTHILTVTLLTTA